MVIPQKFFHDRVVTLLLVVNGFLLLLGTLLILFRLDASQGTGYIIEFRGNLGIGEFKTGSAINIIAFIFFLIIANFLSFIIATRVYPHRHYYAIAVLGMCTILSLMAIVVSNALLVIR